jgi:hypothetical protein
VDQGGQGRSNESDAAVLARAISDDVLALSSVIDLLVALCAAAEAGCLSVAGLLSDTLARGVIPSLLELLASATLGPPPTSRGSSASVSSPQRLQPPLAPLRGILLAALADFIASFSPAATGADAAADMLLRAGGLGADQTDVHPLVQAQLMAWRASRHVAASPVLDPAILMAAGYGEPDAAVNGGVSALMKKATLFQSVAASPHSPTIAGQRPVALPDLLCTLWGEEAVAAGAVDPNGSPIPDPDSASGFVLLGAKVVDTSDPLPDPNPRVSCGQTQSSPNQPRAIVAESDQRHKLSLLWRLAGLPDLVGAPPAAPAGDSHATDAQDHGPRSAAEETSLDDQLSSTESETYSISDADLAPPRSALTQRFSGMLSTPSSSLGLIAGTGAPALSGRDHTAAPLSLASKPAFAHAKTVTTPSIPADPSVFALPHFISLRALELRAENVRILADNGIVPTAEDEAAVSSAMHAAATLSAAIAERQTCLIATLRAADDGAERMYYASILQRGKPLSLIAQPLGAANVMTPPSRLTTPNARLRQSRPIQAAPKPPSSGLPGSRTPQPLRVRIAQPIEGQK